MSPRPAIVKGRRSRRAPARTHHLFDRVRVPTTRAAHGGRLRFSARFTGNIRAHVHRPAAITNELGRARNHQAAHCLPLNAFPAKPRILTTHCISLVGDPHHAAVGTLGYGVLVPAHLPSWSQTLFFRWRRLNCTNLWCRAAALVSPIRRYVLYYWSLWRLWAG